MAIISMKALLESGVHFGHRTNKWDPRMKPYIFTERNGIHIIDLQQLLSCSTRLIPLSVTKFRKVATSCLLAQNVRHKKLFWTKQSVVGCLT